MIEITTNRLGMSWVWKSISNYKALNIASNLSISTTKLTQSQPSHALEHECNLCDMDYGNIDGKGIVGINRGNKKATDRSKLE